MLEDNLGYKKRFWAVESKGIKLLNEEGIDIFLQMGLCRRKLYCLMNVWWIEHKNSKVLFVTESLNKVYSYKEWNALVIL